MSRRVPYWNIEELGTSNKDNGRSTKDHEKAI